MSDEMTKPRAYSYLRFSSPEQIKGGSLERQTRMAHEYARTHGLELDVELSYQDLGISAYRGKNVEAGALGQFLEAVRSGVVPRGSFLLVESLDRISRQSARKALRVLEALCEEGLTVVTLADGKAYTEDALDNDPMSLMMSLLILIRANEESATKSMRHRANWERKRKNAKERPLTKLCPAWLRLRNDRSGFDVLKERAKIVKRIYNESLNGSTTFRIASTLNLENVPTFNGTGRKNPTCWHKSYIVKILQNPAVIGTFTPHKVEYSSGKRRRVPLDPIPGYYPAVVDNEAFYRVQAMKEGNLAPLRGRHAGGVVTNIFASLAKCPICGATMQLNSKGKNSQKYLVCGRVRNGSGCSWRSIRYSTVEEAFLNNYDMVIGDCPSEHKKRKELENRLVCIDVEVEETNIAIENIILSIEKGGYDAAKSIRNRLQELEIRLDTLQQEAEKTRAELDTSFGILLKNKLTDLATALNERNELDRAKVNAILRQLLLKVILNWKSGDAICYWRHGGTSVFAFEWPREYR